MKPGHRAPTVRAVLVVVLGGVLMIATPRLDGVVEVDTRSGTPSPSSQGPGENGAPSLRTPVDRSTFVCPGPERVGLAEPVVPEKPQSVLVEARGAPVEALPPSMSEIEPDPGLGSTPGTISLRTSEVNALGQSDERADPISAEIDGAHGVTLSARGRMAPGVSVVQFFLGDQDEQLGLALTPCPSPREEAWLIAGGGQPGHEERLVLINPSQGPVTATVSLLGAATDPDAQESTVVIALKPGARRVMLLDALAPGEASPVVQVKASGGPVSAYLSDRLLNGTTDRGSEVTAPVRQPARRQLIAGLSVPQDSPSTRVRVAVPGQEQAVVEVAALSASGPVQLDQDVTLVGGQQVADIDLGDLPAGTYVLEVTSDEDIVAAAQVRSPPDERGRDDVAWAASSTPVATLAGSPLPQSDEGPNVRYSLDLTAPQDGSVTVVTTNEGGDVGTESLNLVADHVLTRDLRGASSVWVVPGPEAVLAAVRGEVTVRSRVADDAVTLDAAAATASPAEPPRGAEAVSLISVLPLRELSLSRSVAALTQARP